MVGKKNYGQNQYGGNFAVMMWHHCAIEHSQAIARELRNACVENRDAQTNQHVCDKGLI